MEKDKKYDDALGILRSRRAANEFLRAGRRKARRDSDGFDLAMRFSKMSDEDFDKGVADGTITPDQIRAAGQYEYENYMDDVWSETDQAEEMPQPSYEEFLADPGKYGYSEDPNSERPRRFYRYQKDYQYKAPKDNTAVAPVPQWTKK